MGWFLKMLGFSGIVCLSWWSALYTSSRMILLVKF